MCVCLATTFIRLFTHTLMHIIGLKYTERCVRAVFPSPFQAQKRRDCTLFQKGG